MRPTDAPCQKPQTTAICTTGRSPSGTLCFLYSGRNCVKLTQFLLVRSKQGLGRARPNKITSEMQTHCRSEAPVGLLSGRTVCDSRWRGVAPTSSTNVSELLRRKNKKRVPLLVYVDHRLLRTKFLPLFVQRRCPARSQKV